MVTIPSPVDVLSGDTKSPSVCRAPIVTMRMAAAASTTHVALRLVVSMVELYDDRHIYCQHAGWRRRAFMKVSREQAAQNRERILDAATARFRERGFEGIGVADLMKEAGLTHGGFYGHFGSKEDLIAEACMRASESSKALWA